MEILLQRSPSNNNCTISDLTIPEVNFRCWILEDPIRMSKIKGETAIPAGRYRIDITKSQRFGRLLPLLFDVPNFEGIRIHPGNTAADTEGCLLPGFCRTDNAISLSVLAFQALFQIIRDAKDTVFITIKNPPS